MAFNNHDVNMFESMKSLGIMPRSKPFRSLIDIKLRATAIIASRTVLEVQTAADQLIDVLAEYRRERYEFLKTPNEEGTIQRTDLDINSLRNVLEPIVFQRRGKPPIVTPCGYFHCCGYSPNFSVPEFYALFALLQISVVQT